MNIQLQNILFFPSRGGIENYLYYTAKTLHKLGHRAEIVCMQHEKKLPFEEQFEHIEIYRHKRPNLPFPFTVLKPWACVRAIQSFLKNQNFRPDAIWARHPYYCYASSTLYSKKIPVVYIQATVFPVFLKYYLYSGFCRKISAQPIIYQGYKLEKKAVNNCQKIVVLSKSKKAEIMDFYGISEDKIAVIAPGIDVKNFADNAVAGNGLLKELGINKNARLILTVGRLSAEKNVSFLIKAFAQTKLENTYLLIVGDGWQRPLLEQLVHKLKIADKVKFLGTRSDMPYVYAIADIFVLPSQYEGFGQVYLEAMASGLPCIGLKSNPPGVIVATEEIIEDGRTGYCVDSKTPEDLACKIKKLLGDDELRNMMTEQARQSCEFNYSWEKSVTAVLRVLDFYGRRG